MATVEYKLFATAMESLNCFTICLVTDDDDDDDDVDDHDDEGAGVCVRLGVYVCCGQMFVNTLQLVVVVDILTHGCVDSEHAIYAVSNITSRMHCVGD